MQKESKTLRQLQDQARDEIDKEGVDYSPTNLLLEMGFKVGNLQKFGLKKRLHKKGIGKDNPPEGLRLAMIQTGQLMYDLAAFAERNGFTLDDAREAGEAAQAEKRQADK